MTGKSKLLITVGIVLAICGLVFLASPPRNEYGVPERDTFSSLTSVWLIVSGVGIFFHKKAAFWFYLIGLFAQSIGLNFFAPNIEPEDALILSAIMLLFFGIPAVMVWTRFARLQPMKLRGTNA
jgi:membrane protease YdiL (CAAX protease family)